LEAPITLIINTIIATDYINNSLDRGDKCIGIFLLLAEVFDTVDHRILSYQLEYLKTRGVALKLIKIYFKICPPYKGRESI